MKKDAKGIRYFVSLSLILLSSQLCDRAIAADCEQNGNTRMSVQCGFAKPEDVQYVPTKSLVIVSEQGWKAPESGGTISAVPVDGKNHTLLQKRQLWPRTSKISKTTQLVGDPTCTSEPNSDAFSPHGLAASEGVRNSIVRVAVVGHGAREAIELFDLVGAAEKAELHWRGCVPLPENTAGNDVAIHPDGRLFVTNYIPTVHDFRAALAMKRGSRGEITGDVLEWSSSRGWRHLPGTEMSIPNGVVLERSNARTTLYVAESGRSRVLEFEIASNGDVSKKAEIAVDGSPDDLNWTERHTLLAPIAKTGDTPEWHLEEIDTGKRTSRRVAIENPSVIRSVTSAAEVEGDIVFGSMTDDKIAVSKALAR